MYMMLATAGPCNLMVKLKLCFKHNLLHKTEGNRYLVYMYKCQCMTSSDVYPSQQVLL